MRTKNKFSLDLRFLALLSTLGLLFFYSCSSTPIKRDGPGRARPRTGEKDPRLFDPVRKKIALLQIFNESPFGGKDIGITATEELRYELARSGQFVVDVEAEKIFGTSKEIFAGGGVKLSQLARKAKLSGINFVLFGRVKEARVREKTDEIGFVRKTISYAESYVELRIFDIHSNKEIFSKTIDGNIDDSSYKFFSSKREDKLKYRHDLLRYSVRVAVRKSVPLIVSVASKLNWTGRVAKIIGPKIYVNAGRDSGLNIGDILKVKTEGEEIYDPETGALIGMSAGEVKGTLEIVDYFGPDGTIAILHSGGSVVEGDFVQLY